MINKISSPAPGSPTRSQGWTVSGSPSQNTSSTGTQAWGVVTAAKPVETTRQETPTQTALTPNSKLNPLGYGGNTPLSSNFNASSIFNLPQIDWKNPQVRETIGILNDHTFMPAKPSLGGVPLNTTVASTPYSGANDSLGSSMFSNIIGSLGLGQRNNFVT